MATPVPRYTRSAGGLPPPPPIRRISKFVPVFLWLSTLYDLVFYFYSYTLNSGPIDLKSNVFEREINSTQNGFIFNSRPIFFEGDIG
jgi:hypothetical protein